MHENAPIGSQEATEKQTTEPTRLSQRIAELGVRLVELAKANESLKRELTQHKQAEEKLARHAY